MAKEIEGVLPCVDFAHLHARAGDGSMNSYPEWAAVLKGYKSALGAPAMKRMHIHLAGIQYGPKGERNHLMLAESEFDLNGLLRALREFDCRGRILCESPVMEQDALLIKKGWQRVAR